MNGKKAAIIAIVLWVATIVILGYRFIKGSQQAGEDGRSVILLKDPERTLILSEMRQMLQAVQGIMAGLENNNMNDVADSASGGGTAMMVDVTPSLMMKLPVEFKKQGVGVHKYFDEISLKAKNGSSKTEIIKMMNHQLKSCVACHSGYQFSIKH